MDSLSHYWDLTVVLTRKEIKVRYKNSFLGYLWSVANPLAFAFTFFVVFKVIARFKVEDYAVFLIVALFPWQWFTNSVGYSPTMFSGSAMIIKKINFPRNIIPLTIVLQDMIHFMLSIPVIALFLLIFGRSPSWSWFYGIPLLLFIHLFLTYGIALIISSTNLFFRDMERLTNICLVFLFYFTPVIYSVDMIPLKYRHLVYFNPLAPLMINWRNILLYGTMDWTYLAISATYAAFFSALGFITYRHLSWRFAEVL